jgi:hypothetical protein
MRPHREASSDSVASRREKKSSRHSARRAFLSDGMEMVPKKESNIMPV